MKRTVAFAAACTMVVSALAGGCGNSESSPKGNTDSKNQENTEAAAVMDTENSGGEALGDEANIVLACYAPRAMSTDDIDRVEAAINAITLPEINTSVTIISLEQGNWDQQINLMISGGEQLDLLPTFFYGSTAISSLKAQNQLNELDGLLDEYGQGIKDVMPEGYFETTTQNGSILAVPVVAAKAGGTFCFMRKDILEELDLLDEAQNADSVQDLENIFAKVKEKTELVPIAPSSTSGVWGFTNAFATGDFSEAVTYEDLLGGYIGIMSDNPDKIVNLYETDAYKETCSLLQKWYEAGYIYKDAATDDRMSEEYIKSDVAFCYFNGTELTALSTVNQLCEQEMVPVQIATTPLTTWNIGTITWTIPVTAKEPEAAMKFLNMMYTDERIVNLLNYGIENEDYIVDEDGRFSYPEGKDMNSVGYYNGYTWLFGNQFLAGVRDNEDADIREKGKSGDAKAGLSPNFGFSSDSTGLDTEIAGMTSAKNEFVRLLNCGIGNAQDNLAALNDKMKAAGVDNVIAQLQQQLDDWKNGQN